MDCEDERASVGWRSGPKASGTRRKTIRPCRPGGRGVLRGLGTAGPHDLLLAPTLPSSESHGFHRGCALHLGTPGHAAASRSTRQYLYLCPPLLSLFTYRASAPLRSPRR
jgi:hypothetical protein